MNNTNYTNNYESWLESQKDCKEIAYVGETRTFILLEEFEQMKHFLTAPVGVYNNKTIISREYSFESKEEVVNFITSYPAFKLFRCMESVKDGNTYYIVRGGR